MTRTQAIAQAQQQFDSGAFRQTLARRIAIPTESQNPQRGAVLADYLEGERRVPPSCLPSASKIRPCPRCSATATAM